MHFLRQRGQLSIISDVRVALRYFSQPTAGKRRARFISLATEAARGGAVDAVEDEAWQSALAEFDLGLTGDFGVATVPRFVEQRRPARALRAYLLERAAANTKCVIMGSARDLRFIGIGLNREKSLHSRKLGSLADATGLQAGELGLIEGPVDAGITQGGIALIAAADIIGSRAEQEGSGPQFAPSGGALDFLPVTIGDTVIHEDHGVARLIGLIEDPAISGAELIALEYARDGRRLVAPSDAGRLWRYGSDADAVTLDTLNGKSWEKRKMDVMAAVAGTARDLVALATERAALEAPVSRPKRQPTNASPRLFRSPKRPTRRAPSKPSAKTWPAGTQWNAW